MISDTRGHNCAVRTPLARKRPAPRERIRHGNYREHCPTLYTPRLHPATASRQCYYISPMLPWPARRSMMSVQRRETAGAKTQRLDASVHAVTTPQQQRTSAYE